MFQGNRSLYLKSPEASEFNPSKAVEWHSMEIDPLKKIDELVNKAQEIANSPESKYAQLEARFRSEKGWKLTACLNDIQKEGFTDEQIATAFLNTGKTIYLIDNLERLKIDHRDIALRLIEMGKGRILAKYLKKFQVDHQEIVYELFKAHQGNQVLLRRENFQVTDIELKRIQDLMEKKRQEEIKKFRQAADEKYEKEWKRIHSLKS